MTSSLTLFKLILIKIVTFRNENRCYGVSDIENDQSDVIITYGHKLELL